MSSLQWAYGSRGNISLAGADSAQTAGHAVFREHMTLNCSVDVGTLKWTFSIENLDGERVHGKCITMKERVILRQAWTVVSELRPAPRLVVSESPHIVVPWRSPIDVAGPGFPYASPFHCGCPPQCHARSHQRAKTDNYKNPATQQY